MLRLLLRLVIQLLNQIISSQDVPGHGVGPDGQTMAVLEMLSRHYALPFRRDVIEKQVRNQVRDRPPSLSTLGNLATILGLQGSLSDVAEAQLPRVPTPWVAIVHGQPALIHEVRRGYVKAVLPEYGRLQLPIAELTEGQGGASALILSPGRDAQKRKLSLRWFLPQIRRYRRSLLKCWWLL